MLVPRVIGLSLSLPAEQSTMTTESGSDSESKPEQEAEPQEAAGREGAQPGAQPGPEPAAEEQPQAPEQFEEAAAHSTPVRKEVSLHRPVPLAFQLRTMNECLLSFSRLCSGLGLLALAGTWGVQGTGGIICLSSSVPLADGHLSCFKTFSE